MSDYRQDAYYELRTNEEGSTCFTRVSIGGQRTMHWEDGVAGAYKRLWNLVREGYRIEVIE